LTLQLVNVAINQAISPQDDRDHYGREEYWTIPADGLGDAMITW
jgi:predicted transglutaminase-like cysteine proteinase